MGDYRNDLQGALAQVESLRAENQRLRLQLASSHAETSEAPEVIPPTPVAAPARALVSRTRAALVAGAAAGLVMLGVASMRVRTRAAEPELRMPAGAVVPVQGAAEPLPMPRTTVRLPERPKPATGLREVVEPAGAFPPWKVVSMDRGPWPRPGHGLYVLTTVPEGVRCSVGGALVETPRPVFLSPGEYTVRCTTEQLRQSWTVRVVAGSVTLDLEHHLEV